MQLLKIAFVLFVAIELAREGCNIIGYLHRHFHERNNEKRKNR